MGNGTVMKRDIVQFVPFNDFKNQHISALAKEVLEEVPDQITGFMTMKKLHPLRKGHLSKQSTMANIYEGPSKMVRQETQANVYPNMQQQAPQGQPMNPYYGQQQGAPPQYGMQPQGSPFAQQQVMQQQQGYNPNYGNANAPSAPQY